MRKVADCTATIHGVETDKCGWEGRKETSKGAVSLL